MAIMRLPGGSMFSLGGATISDVPSGAPTSRLSYVATVPDADVIVTLASVPADVTHWQAIVNVDAETDPFAFSSPVIAATTDPTSAGTYEALTGELMNLPENADALVTIQILPIVDGKSGRPGPPRRLTVVTPNIILETAPTLTGSVVGDQSVAVGGRFNISANRIAIVRRLQYQASGGSWADVDLATNPSYDVTVPAAHLAGLRRHAYVATGPNGDVITFTSNEVGPVTDVAVGAPAQLTSATVTIGDSYFVGTGDIWFKPDLTFSTSATNSDPDDEYRFTVSNPATFPNDPITAWEPMVAKGGSSTIFVPMMANGPSNDPNAVPRVDFSVWQAGSLALDRLRVSRRRRTAGVWSEWSPVSPTFTVETPAITPPTSDAEDWRPMLYRGSTGIGGTPDLPELFTRGRYGQDGFQFKPSAAVSADGRFWVVGGDSNSVECSFGGYKWYFPQNRGLPVFQCIGLWIDPISSGDNYTVWALMSAGFEAAKVAKAGVYKSVDSCKNWTFVRAMPSIKGAERVCFNIEGSPTTGAASARRIFAIATKLPTDVIEYWRSDVGGTGGTSVNLSKTTIGVVFCLKPVSATEIYLGGGAGLFKTTNGGTSAGSWTKVLNKGGVRSIWVDPDDDQHHLCTVVSTVAGNVGVYETFNGWTTSVRILAEFVHHLAVGAKNASGQRILYVSLSRGTPERYVAFIRKADGTWINGLTAAPNNVRHIAQGVDASLQPFNMLTWSPNKNDTQAQGWMLADPSDPLRCLCHSKTGIWAAENGGLTWYLSMAGYGGLNQRGNAFDSQPDGSWMRYRAGSHDTGLIRSENACDTMEIFSIPPATKDMINAIRPTAQTNPVVSFSFGGTSVLPNDARVPAAVRGRFFGSFGLDGAGALIYMNQGATTWGHYMGASPQRGQSNANGGGYANRARCGYLSADPMKCWAGANYSLDATQTWRLTGRNIIDEVGDGVNVYGESGGTIYKGNPFTGSWPAAPWYSPNWGWMEGPDPVGAVNKMTGDMVIRGASGNSIVLLRDTGATATSTTFSLASLGLSSSDSIDGVAWDQLDPRYIYFSLGAGAMGTGRTVYRGKLSADFTSVVWTSLTSNNPQSAHTVEVATHEWSGDLICFVSGQGTYVYPTDADWQPWMGIIKFNGLPAANNTLIINGQTITFKTSAPGTNECLIGSSASNQATVLAAALNASANALITPCTYTAYGADVRVSYDAPPLAVLTAFTMSAAGTPNAEILKQKRVNKRGLWNRLPLPIYKGV